MNNKFYFLALNRISQVGPRTIYKLLGQWENLDEVFKMSAQKLEQAGIPAKAAHAIASFDLNEVEADLRWAEGYNHHLLTWADETYPAILREIYDPPPVLYVKGDLTCFNQPMIAMVGSRKPTISGGETAHRFAYELAQKNVTIVSGLALGIDAYAHRGALRANGCTIATMATGIDRIYPFRHQELAEKISDKGVVITEFPLKTAPFPGHFPRRNRIISGLSLATLVVEAAIKSGSLITARLALEQNRDVMAIPGSIHNPLARGCHQLLQQGAKLVSSSDDVLGELGLNQSQIVKQDVRTHASDHNDLVKCIGFEVTTVDQIVARSGLGLEQVACNLAELEIQGIVQAVPGGYMRCTI